MTKRELKTLLNEIDTHIARLNNLNASLDAKNSEDCREFLWHRTCLASKTAQIGGKIKNTSEQFLDFLPTPKQSFDGTYSIIPAELSDVQNLKKIAAYDLDIAWLEAIANLRKKPKRNSPSPSVETLVTSV